MAVTITIIGLGQIGASIGLALDSHKDKVTRYGHDREPIIAKQAQEMGAVDKIFYNLPASVEQADVVLLALPIDQIRDTLQIIAPYLQDHSVLMETSPFKGLISEWMKEMLLPNLHYVGLLPIINPKYFQIEQRGIESANSDMFENGFMAVVAPQGTASKAIKLGADLAVMVGADPYFADLSELDGIMSALLILPQLTSASLTEVVTGRSGWNDAQKLAGGAFAKATESMLFETESITLVESIFQNSGNVIQVIDEMIISLEDLKKKISDLDKESLSVWLENTRQKRSKWWQERNAGDMKTYDFDMVKIPKTSFKKRWFGNLFGGRKPDKQDEKVSQRKR